MPALRSALLVAFGVGLACSITLSQSALAALAVLWLLRLGDAGARRRVPVAMLGPLAAFSGATLLSAAVAGPPGGLATALRGLALAAAILVVTDALPDARAADRFLTLVALAATVAALAAVIQWTACPAAPPASPVLAWFFHRCGRARGFFSIYMTLGGVLTPILLATAPRLLPGSGRRPLFLPAWVLMLGALLATLVRGAWVGFGVGMVALATLVRRGRLLLLLGLVVVVGFGLLGPARVSQRLQSLTDAQDITIKERRLMWRSGLAMWREHPWLGVGAGGVKHRYPEYALPEALKKRTGHLHNSPLHVLVEGGLLGLATWLWIWVAFAAVAWRLLRRLPAARALERGLVAGCLAAVIGFLVTSLSEHSFGDAEVVMVVWTLMALPFVVARSAGVVEAPAEASCPRPS